MATPLTLQDYAARMERVHDYLSAHLDCDLDLDHLAGVACFSPFHFHRIYHALQGETVAESVRRMRLHRAALDLIDGTLPIARVASRAGYGSQAAFTRAFRSAYGTPPAAYRVASASRFEGSVEIRRSEPIAVVARAHHGDYDGIGATFERLNATAIGRGWVTGTTRYFGVYYDDPSATPADALRSDACVTSPPGPDMDGGPDLRPLRIAGGTYAVLLHVGPYAELPRAYTWLYREWLPSSGREPADLPCVEEYLNNPRLVPPSELRTEIWLPLAAEGDGSRASGAATPRRVVVVGNSGSGKSTLAAALARDEGLAHLDLDTLAWLPTDPPARRPLPDSAAEIRRFTGHHEAWVVEGCYADLAQLVLPAASELIFLNPGVEACERHCRARPWEPHKYPSREAQDANLAMLLDWVRAYPTRDDACSLASHRRLFDTYSGSKREIGDGGRDV